MTNHALRLDGGFHTEENLGLESAVGYELIELMRLSKSASLEK